MSIIINNIFFCIWQYVYIIAFESPDYKKKCVCVRVCDLLFINFFPYIPSVIRYFHHSSTLMSATERFTLLRNVMWEGERPVVPSVRQLLYLSFLLPHHTTAWIQMSLFAYLGFCV